MPEFSTYCHQCGNKVAALCGETAIDGRLRWYHTYRCPDCLAVIEADAIGFPPDDVRELILHESGEWAVLVPVDGDVRRRITRVLRDHLNMSLREVVECLRQAPATVYIGTRVEAEWLAQVFRDLGVSSSIVPHENS